MGPIIPGENQTLHSTVRTLCQRLSMVVVLGWYREFCSLSENSTGECQAICLWAEVQLGHAARQWSKTHNQVYMKMSKKQHIWSFGTALSKSRPNPNGDVEVLERPSQSPDLIPMEMWQDLKRTVHVWKPTNIAKINQFCMEEWGKCLIPLVNIEAGVWGDWNKRQKGGGKRGDRRERRKDREGEEKAER
jgi:uncharacterized protein YeaC (DUF1315 family)